MLFKHRLLQEFQTQKLEMHFISLGLNLTQSSFILVTTEWDILSIFMKIMNFM